MRIFSFKTAAIFVFLLMQFLTTWGRTQNNGTMGFVNITHLNGLTTNTIYDTCTDKNGCLWIGTSAGLSSYDGYYINNYFKEEMGIRSNTIKYLLCDKRNRLWIGSVNGIGIYDIPSKRFLNLDILSGESMEYRTAGLFEDSEGTIWVSLRHGEIISIDPDTFNISRHFSNSDYGNYFLRIWFEPEEDLYLATGSDTGLYLLDMKNGVKTHFSPSDRPTEKPFAKKRINGIAKVDDNTFCLTCKDGSLWLINPYEKTYRQLPLEAEEKNKKARKVFVIGEKIIGIAHNGGLTIYNLKKEKTVKNKITQELEGKNVYCVCGDLERGLIIGTHQDGVIIQQETGLQISTIRRDKKQKHVTLKESNVTGFAQTNDTTLWIATQMKGLFRYDTKNKRLYCHNNPDISRNLDGIVYHRGHLWLRNRSEIIRLTPPGTSEVKVYRDGSGENKGMIATKDDRLILLSDKMLFQYDETEDSFVPVKEFKNLSVLGIGLSDSNILVAMTEEKGIVRWEAEGVKSIKAPKTDHDSHKHWSGLISEDSSSQVWYAHLESGVFISSKEHFNSITTRSGLPSDVITNIISDDSGNVFITTDRSLSKISPSGKLYSKTKADGLLNYGFTKESAFKTSSGNIMIGSRDGITVIHRSKRKNVETTQNNGIVENITCDGIEIPINETGTVSIRHNQNKFEISIPSIDPHNIISGKSLYCLEGYDHTWVPAGSGKKLVYSGLKSGRYTFRAYDKDINPITIHIKAHPLVSVTACIIYIVILIVIMGFIIMYIREHEVRKRKEKTLQMKVALHQDKIDFFTNIAHEIKTPLTLITTPLEHLKENPNLDEDARYDIDIMNRHSAYLHSLVKELLEFSRIERNKLRINCAALDICEIIDNIATNYSKQSPSFKWTISIPEHPIWCLADKSATIKILNNLIFNATKYAESFINITVSDAGDGYATFAISNDGKVIPQNMREKIFDSFVQYPINKDYAHEGFGIGLSIAKTLANLQNGKLTMGSSDTTNDFICKLPLTEAPTVHVEDEMETPEEIGTADPEGAKNTILVVEDHEDLLEYIQKKLSSHYNILTANNGAKAYNIIQSKTNIDLVITDLRMPGMDGLDLCRKIKSDPTFSHILMVILSANLTHETNIESLKVGADAIIEKPFSMDFLISRVENLIESKRKLIERISQNQDFHIQNEEKEGITGLSIKDMVFLKQLNNIIEENYTDADFGVDEMARLLNMSRSSLNRKMRDILNTTANHYIREKRVTVAEELLRTTQMQINEICYRVGFQTPSYFIKCFRNRYGKSPSEYANSNQ